MHNVIPCLYLEEADNICFADGGLVCPQEGGAELDVDYWTRHNISFRFSLLIYPCMVIPEIEQPDVDVAVMQSLNRPANPTN